MGIVPALFALLLLLVSVPLYVGDTRYVDCRSGRIMREVHIAGLRVRQQIQETEFSRIVAGNGEVNMAAAEWKPYFSRSRFWQPVSPHYRFHSVPHDLDELVAWLRMQERTEEEVRARCLEALRFLNAQDVGGLKRYCTSLYHSRDALQPARRSHEKD